MTVYDDTVAAFRSLGGDPFRWARIVQIARVTWEPDPSGTSRVLTPWVDLGSGPVPALMSQSYSATVNSTADYGTLTGSAVIVVMTPAPTILDSLGTVRLSYP